MGSAKARAVRKVTAAEISSDGITLRSGHQMPSQAVRHPEHSRQSARCCMQALKASQGGSVPLNVASDSTMSHVGSLNRSKLRLRK